MRQYRLKLAALKRKLKLKDKRIEELEAENRILAHELAKVRAKLFGRKTKDKEKPTGKPKKKGAPKGHPGWFRKKPDAADKEIELCPKKCPNCGSSNINKYNRKEEHIVEDIVVPKVKVTKYIRYYGYCKDCHKVFRPKGADELFRSYIGPTAKAFAAYLKYKVKVSDRDIADLFKKMFNLEIDPSSISGFRNQLRRAGYPLYRKLLKSLKNSPYINADETGWSLDGINHWLWNFSNKNISITHIDRSRGSRVIEDILGKKYGGVLISDFLAAYNKIEAKAKQKCIVHLKRYILKAKEHFEGDSSILRYLSRLDSLIDYAISLKEDYLKGKIKAKEFNKKREDMVDQIGDFSFPHPQKGILSTLAKRLKKHGDSLFTFLYHDVPWHNNHAEQQIRPHVLLRKITFGNRSKKGIVNHSIISSIIQTAKLNNADCYKILKKVLLKDTKVEDLLPLIRSP